MSLVKGMRHRAVVQGEVVPSPVCQQKLTHLAASHHAGNVERSVEPGVPAVDIGSVGEQHLDHFNVGWSVRSSGRKVNGRGARSKGIPVDQSPVSQQQLPHCLAVALTQQIEERIS